MGKTQKKNSKGRLDRYYYLAKEKVCGLALLTEL
jgi:hypothetical protein